MELSPSDRIGAGYDVGNVQILIPLCACTPGGTECQTASSYELCRIRFRFRNMKRCCFGWSTTSECCLTTKNSLITLSTFSIRVIRVLPISQQCSGRIHCLKTRHLRCSPMPLGRRSAAYKVRPEGGRLTIAHLEVTSAILHRLVSKSSKGRCSSTSAHRTTSNCPFWKCSDISVTLATTGA